MDFTCPNKLVICLFIVFFSQLSYGQRAISEKVNENLNKIRETTQKIPLQEVSEDLLETPIEKSILNQKQILQINSTQVQSIKNDNSEYLRLSLPIKGQDVELQLYKANIFTENFRAELSSEPNKNMRFKKGLHYWGIVADDPNSLATISFVGDEIVGGVHFNGEQISLVKLKNSDYHVIYANKDLKHSFNFSCEALPIEGSPLLMDISEAAGRSNLLLDCVGIHVEVDRSVYQGFGNNLTNTTNYVNALFAQVAALYANESIAVAISFLRVWDTADPYGSGSELNDLTNQGYGTTNGNLVHLLHSNGGGGVAYLQGLCDNTFNTGVSNIFRSFNNVPTYSWDVEVFTHEIGHNLGSPHTHACAWNGNNTAIDGCGPASGNSEGCNAALPPNGGTIMSYCHLVNTGINFNLGFGTQPGNVIRNFTASQNCGDFCTVVCPAQVNTPYSRTEDICAGIGSYTLPTSYTGLVLDNDSAAEYEWSAGNYISAGGTPVSGSYALNNPSGCDPVIQRLYLNVGCTGGGLNDIDAGILTLNVYPDPAQFTATDLVTVSGENTCDEPVFSANCAGVTITPDAANPTFPASSGQSGTANYTITYTPQAGAPNCCVADAGSGTELITNGDFEAGTTGWTETEEVPTGTPNANPFGVIGVSNGALNGSNDAWFGGWGTSSPNSTSYLTISQNITIPPTCGGAELTFDFGMSCANGGITLSVAVNGVVLGTLGCTDGSTGSITPFDLVAAGAPTGNVTFSIIGNEDGTGSDAPDIYIDNVSIITTNCTAPVVCDIPVSATYDCQQACAGLDLDINFDGSPAQTSWEITDTGTGGVMASGGTYGSQTGGSSLSLPSVACLPDGCYELTFYDSGNDGMCPRRTSTVLTGINIASIGLGGVFNGIPRVGANCGDYTLYAADGTVIASGGGRFGSSETNSFCIVGGIPQFNYQPDNVYARQNTTSGTLDMWITPTLTTDAITVYSTLDERSDAQISVVDINGKIIQQYSQERNTTRDLRLDVSDLPSGIYFVQMVANDIVLVEKFVKR